MITTIQAFKENYVSNFKNELDQHVLAFFIKYGAEYWNNEGSVYEYIQNNSEDDLNDENMITIRNKQKELQVMLAFNEEFDDYLWPSGSKVK